MYKQIATVYETQTRPNISTWRYEISSPYPSDGMEGITTDFPFGFPVSLM